MLYTPGGYKSKIKSTKMEALQHPCVIQWLDSFKKATKEVYINRITEVLDIEARMLIKY